MVWDKIRGFLGFGLNLIKCPPTRDQKGRRKEHFEVNVSLYNLKVGGYQHLCILVLVLRTCLLLKLRKFPLVVVGSLKGWISPVTDS